MTYPKRALSVFVIYLLPAMAIAEVPLWLNGLWQAHAQVRAPDGQRLRIRCSLEAGEVAQNDWRGTLRCASVQGRFHVEWDIAIEGGSAKGQVTFTRPEGVSLNVTGAQTETKLQLRTSDGQAVAFANQTDGVLAVDMTNLGPQRLTGRISFTAE